MHKINIIPQTVFEVSKFEKSCNLIGGEYFDLYLKNQIFHRHAVFTKSFKAPFKAQKVMLLS